MRLLLATRNPGKVKKIADGLVSIPWPIVTPGELGINEFDVDESGATLEANARLKARGFWDAAHARGYDDVAVLADDGGLEIDVLDGAPGVYAKRWAGENATDDDRIDYTLRRLEGIPPEKRTARFRVVQILLFPDGSEHVVHGVTEGWITEARRPLKVPGLPYGALLVAERFGKVLDDLSPEELQTTHRVTALREVRELIRQRQLVACSR